MNASNANRVFWALYNALFVLVFPLLLPRFLARMRKRGGYARNFGDRFGAYGPAVRRALQASPDPIWLHAVSVGELLIALRLVEEIRAREPGARFVVSVTTSTGYHMAEARLRAPDAAVYFPVDVPPIVRRVLRRIRPRAILLVEGEWWPNLLRQARASGIPVVLVNARMSDRSFKRYRLARAFTRRLLPLLALGLAQGDEERKRFLELGADPARLRVMGNAKFDLPRPAPEVEAIARGVIEALRWPDDALLLLGGSTWPGEEAALADSYRRLRADMPRLRLILLPRHAERAEDILRELDGLGLRVARRSTGETPDDADVLLVDSTGEAMGFYAVSDIVFVGKSLTRHGGQNPIEPAALGKPVLVGPHMENFRGVMSDLLREQAVVQVADVVDLEQAIIRLARDPESRARLGDRAREAVRSRAGVLARTAEACLEVIRLEKRSD